MTVQQSMKGDRTMSRVIIRSLGLAALLALAVTSAWAGSDERKGTSGAAELTIPVGPRGSAMGASVASNIVGAEAIFWNPAGTTLSSDAIPAGRFPFGPFPFRTALLEVSAPAAGNAYVEAAGVLDAPEPHALLAAAAALATVGALRRRR